MDISRTTKLFTVAPDMCGSLFHTTFPAPRILRWLLEFGSFVASCTKSASVITLYLTQSTMVSISVMAPYADGVFIHGEELRILLDMRLIADMGRSSGLTFVLIHGNIQTAYEIILKAGY